MRSKYNHNVHQRSSFLPMLCSKPSIKDVRISKWDDRSASFSDDPLSPRVGCMGQVKRNNKVAGFPTTFHRFNTTTTTTTTTKTNDDSIKYFKLKKFFSSKNLLSPTTTTTTSTTTSSSSSRGQMITDGSINVVDLDPPLPVIKPRVQQRNDGGDANNLWKRRAGGVALKSLQVQQIHLPNHNYLQPTSV